MKDRPAAEGVAPSSPTFVSRLVKPIRPVLAHFWKIFAATSLIAGLCVWYARYSGVKESYEPTSTRTPSDDDAAPHGRPHRFRILADLIDKQSQPAAVVFKNQAPSALGYLASVDNECVVLRSLYKEEAKEQTILIPWENILYIRLSSRMPTPEPEVTASRDLRSKPVVRQRR